MAKPTRTLTDSFITKSQKPLNVLQRNLVESFLLGHERPIRNGFDQRSFFQTIIHNYRDLSITDDLAARFKIYAAAFIPTQLQTLM